MQNHLRKFIWTLQKIEEIWSQIGNDLIEYITDNTPKKQGLFTSGMHIPVVPPKKFKQDKPDHVLLLAWNHEAEILEKEYRGGGKFIIPVSNVKII